MATPRTGRRLLLALLHSPLRAFPTLPTTRIYRHYAPPFICLCLCFACYHGKNFTGFSSRKFIILVKWDFRHARDMLADTMPHIPPILSIEYMRHFCGIRLII